MKHSPLISVTITGHNEAHLLPGSLASAAWADEIVYVDCESSDDSQKIARRYTKKVYMRPNNLNLNVNKAYALEQAVGDWVFYLDPDEEISAALAKEIRWVVASNPQENAFCLPRRNHYFGRWLRHGGQYPDVQLRLFRRGNARFPCRHVHEKLEVQGTIGRLQEALDHHSVASPQVSIDKMDFFSTFEACVMVHQGLRPNIWNALGYCVMKPWGRFWRRWLFKRGCLDGWAGFVQAVVGSVDFPIRFIKFWWFFHHPDQMPSISASFSQSPKR